MTAPVTSSSSGAGTFIVRFSMPRESAFETLPTPVNDRVRVVQVDEHLVLARRFRGASDPARIDAGGVELLAYAAEQHLDVEGPPVWAGYSAPYVPPPLRRWEVLLRVARRRCPVRWRFRSTATAGPAAGGAVIHDLQVEVAEIVWSPVDQQVDPVAAGMVRPRRELPQRDHLRHGAAVTGVQRQLGALEDSSRWSSRSPSRTRPAGRPSLQPAGRPRCTAARSTRTDPPMRGDRSGRPTLR